MPNCSRRHRLLCLLPALLLVTLITGCGDDGSAPASGDQEGTAGDDGMAPDGEDEPGDESEPGNDFSLPPDVEAALLASDDIDGWEAEQDYFDLSFADCPDHPEEWDAIETVVRVALSPEGEAWSGDAFQDMVILSDEDAAEAYFAVSDEMSEGCPAEEETDPETERTDLEIDAEDPLDITASGLGENATGAKVTFRPHPFDEVVEGMESVTFQKGNIVVTVSVFVPVASDLDVIGLAELSYDRLPG